MIDNLIPLPNLQVKEADRPIGRLPRRMKKPLIYFAGRMAGCKQCSDWRDRVAGFPGLYALESAGDADVDTILNCGSFRYSGPFVLHIGSGHTIGHTLFHDQDVHQECWDVDARQIARSDLMVAFIEDTECYGTLCEIGFAYALGIPIALVFSDKLSQHDYGELWLCRMLATKVYVSMPAYFWTAIRHDWIIEST